jgi:serine phosphatase RsbU (regulator of sigma subunit)
LPRTKICANGRREVVTWHTPQRIGCTIGAPMNSFPDNSAIDDLLHQLSKSFLLDEPIAGHRLGDLLAETIREADRRPLPDLGEAGDRRTVRRDVDEPLTFLYRPHLFPGMEEALRLGHAVQYHLLPRGLPADTPVDVAAVLESYCHLSGDLFGWRGESDRELTLWLLDVSGHGVRSGFASVVMKMLLAEMDPGLPLTEMPRLLENRFEAARNPDDPALLYATGAFLRIAEDGALNFVSAGHQPLLLCRADGSVERLEATGMPVALISGGSWEEKSTRLAEGDSLLLFSDGLVELRNDAGEEFGEERVTEVLRRGGPAPEIVQNLLRAFEQFHDLDRLDDDLSLIVLQRRAPR